MKKLLKIYKMFYRLLRLKHHQRQEIERFYSSLYKRNLNNLYEEFFVANTKLKDYEAVTKLYGIKDPFELFNILAGLPIKSECTKSKHIFLKNFLENQYKRTLNEII